MANIKIGDRVKVEFEGAVTYVHRDQQVEVGGFGIPPEATVTVRPPEEPTGVGAVARVTYLGYMENPHTYVTVRGASGVWHSEEQEFETWDGLFENDGTVEILSPGVTLDNAP